MVHELEEAELFTSIPDFVHKFLFSFDVGAIICFVDQLLSVSKFGSQIQRIEGSTHDRNRSLVVLQPAYRDQLNGFKIGELSNFDSLGLEEFIFSS